MVGQGIKEIDVVGERFVSDIIIGVSMYVPVHDERAEL